MAFLGFNVEGHVENHVTLIHFDKMDTDKAMKVDKCLVYLIHKVKNPPSAVYGRPILVGKYHNVKAIQLVSPYILSFQKGLAALLEHSDIEFSKDYGFNPHVSRPQPEMQTGMEVPLSPWLNFVWKEHGTAIYSLD